MNSTEEVLVGMRLIAIGSEIQGRVRAVYADGRGREYVIISGDKIWIGDNDDGFSAGKNDYSDL